MRLLRRTGFHWRSATGLAALAVSVAACTPASGSTHIGPQPSVPGGASQVVVLSLVSTASGVVLPNDTQQVKLTPGQTLAVETTQDEEPGGWSQTDAGDAGVVAPGATTTMSPCPAAMLGCDATTARLYRARAAGTSTIVWTYSGLGPSFSAPPSQPRQACAATDDAPSGGKPQQCPVGVVRITVTVS